MIDMARLVCKSGKFKLMIEADGRRHEFDLTKTRALYLMESGMEAMRESEVEEEKRVTLISHLYSWVCDLPIKHPQQDQWRQEAKKISEER